MTELSMGANTALPASAGEVVIRHRDSAGIDVNLTAFLVAASGKVRSDADMVFFNQPAGENGSARYAPPAKEGGDVVHRLAFDLARVPASVEKIVVALTEDGGGGFAAVGGLRADVRCGDATIALSPLPKFTTEKGIMVAEVYLRGGQHKVRANWQGFASGLAGLATAHGVDVEEPAPAAAAPPKPAAPPPKPAAAASPAISFRKVSGQVNLKKGDKPVLMEKTALITASVKWRSGTDYDVYALVMTKDGQQIDVATFGAKGVKPLPNYGNGAVKHLGDVKGSKWGAKKAAEQVETVEIRLRPDIVAVVPVAYSAQSNGTGSFYKYKVSLHIDNGAGTRIDVSADNANNDDKIYTCVPGIIRNTDEGVVIEPLELYSERTSEKRPALKLGKGGEVTVVMDAGPRNKYK